VSVPRRDQLSFEVAYVCVAENAERILRGLAAAEMTGAVIVVGDDIIALERKNAVTPLDAAWANGPIALSGPIVRVLAFDADSPSSEFDPAARAQLSHRRREVTVRLLTERVVPYFPIFAGGVQRRLVGKVRESVRSIVGADPDTYGYLPTTGTRQEDVVKLLATPETRDPRGRTQAYQAMYGRRTRLEGSERRQPDLLDLLAENADRIVGQEPDNEDDTADAQSALDDEDIMDGEEEV
jgi:hypothetical protein